MTPLFRFTDIRGGYQGSIVVRGVDGWVDRGQVLCVLGRNGVGKSTLIRLLFGFLPSEGTVEFEGKPISGLDPTARSHLGLALAPQERVVFDGLSVRDNLTLMRNNQKLDDFEPYFERFPRLKERLSQMAGTLSGGERKLLSFVRLLSEDKQLILLDEPSEGVQRENIEHMAALILEQKQAGKAFIMVEQNLGLMDAVADTIMVMDQGRCVLRGDAGQISRNEILVHLEI